MDVIDALEQARRQHGLPTTIRVDQGQFTSKELDLWAYANGVTLDFSRPGKPTDNAYVESFNATVRLECLGRHWFLDLDDAREKVEEWRIEYNEVRPHSAIGDRPWLTTFAPILISFSFRLDRDQSSDRLWCRQCAQEVAKVVSERMKLQTHRVGGERPA
jgi:transposase InsO family protein